jgi:hypothetical protein
VSGAEPPAPPLLRVVRGDPTEEELAALVALLAARSASAPARGGAAERRIGGWADRSAGVRRPLRAGPGAWRASVR